MELPGVERIGPVDVALIDVDGSWFNGEVAPALIEAHESGTVRILDFASLHTTDEEFAAEKAKTLAMASGVEPDQRASTVGVQVQGGTGWESATCSTRRRTP